MITVAWSALPRVGALPELSPYVVTKEGCVCIVYWSVSYVMSLHLRPLLHRTRLLFCSGDSGCFPAVEEDFKGFSLQLSLFTFSSILTATLLTKIVSRFQEMPTKKETCLFCYLHSQQSVKWKQNHTQQSFLSISPSHCWLWPTPAYCDEDRKSVV